MYLFLFLTLCSWPPDYLQWDTLKADFPVVEEELWESIQHFILKAFKGRQWERQKAGQKERTKEFRGMHYSARLEITLFTGSTKPKCPGGFHYLSFSNAVQKKSSHLSRSQFQESQFIQLNGIKVPVGKRFQGGWGRETVQFLHLSVFLTVCMGVCIKHTHPNIHTSKAVWIPVSTELFVYLHAGQFCKSCICQDLSRFTCIDL